MRYVGIFILLLLNSCTTCKKQVSDLTKIELTTLSEDCKYMQKEITKWKKRTLEVYSQKPECYLQNDYLRSLLLKTNCFDVMTQQEIKKIFGKPDEQCLDSDLCLSLNIGYYFFKTIKDFYIVSFVFDEHGLTDIRESDIIWETSKNINKAQRE